jgi:peptide/nickel transport system permease protein
MLRLVLNRLAALPFVLFGVSLILFLVARVIPVDPVRLIVGEASSAELRDAIIHKLGLDRPLYVQYVEFVKGLFHGDLGESTRFQLPVRQLIAQALPASLQLVAAAAVITVATAVAVGVISARFRGRWPDVMGRGLVVIGVSTPAFFLGIVLIIVFGHYLGLLPVSGRGKPPDLAHLVLPAVVLGIREAAGSARILRAGMIDTFGEDHVRAARARGIGPRSILFKSSFRNALIPTVTDLGVSLTELAGSLVLVETVFGWPGIGNLLYVGIRWNDFPLVSGVVLTLVIYAVVINMIIDMLYSAIDPRVR